MIYNTKVADDSLVQTSYDEGMNELNSFWGIGWRDNTPDIFIIESRKEVDRIKASETSGELVGWSKNRNIFVLDFKKIESESSYHLTPDQYKALIKHELNHLFHGIVSGGSMGPLWFREGLSIYLSGQITLGQWPRPIKLSGFIESSEENKKFAYAEGGFVIELLVKEFGKEKLIEFVKNMKMVKNNADFKKLFLEIFGVEFEYEALNNLIKP